jgi:hypothetical protein
VIEQLRAHAAAHLPLRVVTAEWSNDALVLAGDGVEPDRQLPVAGVAARGDGLQDGVGDGGYHAITPEGATSYDSQQGP